MPLIPERLQSRQDVKSAIACQFWEQPSHSTRSIDGLVWSLPCEPPALNLTGSSGLSRTQQLIAAQALGAPAVPSYDANSEGLVLDRVLGKLGGKSWWTALAGRVKVQRMLRLARQATGGKRKIHTLRDLDSYGVVARGRFQLGRRLTLNAVVETPTATLLHKRAQRHAAAVARVVSKWVQPAQAEATAAAAPDATAGPGTTPSNGSGTMPNGLGPAPEPHSAPAEGGIHTSAPPPLSAAPVAAAAAAATGAGPASPRAFPTSPRAGSSSSAEGSGTEPGELFRGHTSLKYVLPGHDLTATLGWQQDYVDSSGEYAHVPLAASLDLASQYRPDGLQYRVGLHQVTAPAVEGSSKAARRMRTTLHIQGAVAVEGEAHIWKPAPPATQQQQQQQSATAPAAQSSAPPTPNSIAAPQGAGPAPAGPAAGPEGASAKNTAQEQQGGGSVGGQGQQQQQDSQPKEEKPAGRVATALTAAAEADAGPDPATLPPRRPRGEKKKKKKHKLHKRHKEAEHQHHQHHHQQQQHGEEGQERRAEHEQHPGPGPTAATSDTAASGRGAAGTSADFGEPHQAHPTSEAAGEEAGAAAAMPAAATKPSSSGGGSRQGRGSGSDEPAGAGEVRPGGEEPTAKPGVGGSADGHGGEGEGEHSRASLESFMRPLGDLIHTVTHPREGQQPGGAGLAPSGGQQQQQQQQQQQRGGKGEQQHLEGEQAGEEGPPPSLSPTASNLHFLTVSAKTIQAGIQESLALLEQVKESVGRLTTEVQEGSLQRLGKQLADSSGRKEPPAPRRRPYSVFLSQPHLKLNGSMGCLARMPLPPLRGSTGLAGLEVGAPAGGGGMRGGLGHPPGASSASLSSLGSTGLAQAWEPYLKGTSLRLFASGGISGQLGRFTRPFLDYTAAALRVDVGLTSPHVVGLLPDPSSLVASDTHRPDKHRAFALEGRGSWHSLSASLAQQVVGPVRARADFRFALDPTNMPQNAGERSTIKGLVQTALSVRPSLLEAVFGFDVVLPGTEGAARLACWWSPHRREAMAELRLF